MDAVGVFLFFGFPLSLVALGWCAVKLNEVAVARADVVNRVREADVANRVHEEVMRESTDRINPRSRMRQKIKFGTPVVWSFIPDPNTGEVELTIEADPDAAPTTVSSNAAKK